MEQTSWFEWVEECDPIYIELQKLDNQTTVYVAPFTITKNVFGLFEMEAMGIHDCCSTFEKCYKYLCEYSTK